MSSIAGRFAGLLMRGEALSLSRSSTVYLPAILAIAPRVYESERFGLLIGAWRAEGAVEVAARFNMAQIERRTLSDWEGRG